MQQYFAKNENLDLDKDDYYHIINVMRMKIGEKVRIIYNDYLYICKITKIEKTVSFCVESKTPLTRHKIKVISAFSLIKEQRQDYLLQKGTEVGIDLFIPFKSKRSIIKIDEKKDSKKKERWGKIIKEAAEQSYGSFIPEIKDVMTLKDLVNIKADLKILFTLNEKTKNIKKVLQNLDKCDTILITTGPEGGFEIEEEKYLIDNGFVSACIGDNVLRSETAPVAITSIINYEFER